MITGAHAVLYSHDVVATRAFLRDVLELESVDAGGGWLIFGLPSAEIAAHPAEAPPRQELFLMCDDLKATIAALRARGAELGTDVTEERWGLMTALRVPGAGEVRLYEPRHPRP